MNYKKVILFVTISLLTSICMGASHVQSYVCSKKFLVPLDEIYYHPNNHNIQDIEMLHGVVGTVKEYTQLRVRTKACNYTSSPESIYIRWYWDDDGWEPYQHSIGWKYVTIPVGVPYRDIVVESPDFSITAPISQNYTYVVTKVDDGTPHAQIIYFTEMSPHYYTVFDNKRKVPCCSYNFAYGTPQGWQECTAPPYTSPIFLENYALGLKSTDYNTFGYWDSHNIGYDADYFMAKKLTYAQVKISTNVTDKSKVPGFRFRIYDTNYYDQTALLNYGSYGTEAAPTSSGKDYFTFYTLHDNLTIMEPNPFVVNEAFDILNFDSSDQIDGTLWQHKVDLWQTDLYDPLAWWDKKGKIYAINYPKSPPTPWQGWTYDDVFDNLQTDPDVTEEELEIVSTSSGQLKLGIWTSPSFDLDGDYLYAARVSVYRTSISNNSVAPELRLRLYGDTFQTSGQMHYCDNQSPRPPRGSDIYPSYYWVFYKPDSEQGGTEDVQLSIEYIQMPDDSYTTFKIHSVNLYRIDPIDLF